MVITVTALSGKNSREIKMAERRNEEEEQQQHGDSRVYGNANWEIKLPDGCTTPIVSRTSPRDACRLSTISSEFRLVAQSDTVWEVFLPPDLEDILSRSVTPLVFPSKKQLFFRLCQSPILLDGGTKSLILDKWTGCKCVMLGARELSIAWGDNPRYWSWVSSVDSESVPKSRFREVAYLQHVCWLEIKGEIETKMLSKNTKYKAYLVYFVSERNYGLDYRPAKVAVGLVDPEGNENESEDGAKIAYLQISTFGFWPQQEDAWFPKEREDGWLELEMGEFSNGEQDGILRMRLRETENLHWKSGIVVQGIELRPHCEHMNTGLI